MTEADRNAFEGENPGSPYVVRLPAEIPDFLVAAVAEAAIGHEDYDSGVLPSRAGSDGANSNSFGRAIVEQAAQIAGVDPATIPNPRGNAPLADAADRVQFDQKKLEQAKEQYNNWKQQQDRARR